MGKWGGVPYFEVTFSSAVYLGEGEALLDFFRWNVVKSVVGASVGVGMVKVKVVARSRGDCLTLH